VFCYASRCLVPLMMELFALFFCRYCEATFGLYVRAPFFFLSLTLKHMTTNNYPKR